MGDIDAGEARRARRSQQILEPAARQGLHVHQMVVAVDPGGGKGVLVQGRRKGLLDVGADQANKHTRRHDRASSTGARPPPRKSWAMRGSARILAAVSSIRVWPCSRTSP